jgi:hypothetical protein
MSLKRREVLSKMEIELAELTKVKLELNELKAQYDQQKIRSKGLVFLGWDITLSSSNLCCFLIIEIFK